MEYSSTFLEGITSPESDVSESDSCSCEAACELETVCSVDFVLYNLQLEAILPFLQVLVLKSLLKVHQMFLISKCHDHIDAV